MILKCCIDQSHYARFNGNINQTIDASDKSDVIIGGADANCNT